MRWILGFASALVMAAPAGAADVGSRATWLSPQHNAAAFQGMEELFPSRRVQASPQVLPLHVAARMSAAKPVRAGASVMDSPSDELVRTPARTSAGGWLSRWPAGGTG